jgi:hypothetical protein
LRRGRVERLCQVDGERKGTRKGEFGLFGTAVSWVSEKVGETGLGWLVGGVGDTAHVGSCFVRENLQEGLENLHEIPRCRHGDNGV